MSKAVNYMAGTVRVRLNCKYPERVINICAGNGVNFWDLERQSDGSALMTVYISGYRKLRELARRDGIFTVKPVKREGVPFLLWRIRKRYVLLLGMALCFLAVWTSSFFIWQIEVTGNEEVSTSQILAALQKAGVKIGTCTLTLQQERIQNEMLLMVPELSWIAVNAHGSRAQVLVREKVEIPEIIDNSIPTHVYAEKSGIITKMTVLRGTPQVAVGDTVLAGDMLVSGVVASVSSGDRLVRADAEILARTWYEMSESMPLACNGKLFTGSEKSRCAVILGGKRINLYFSGGNPYACYDKITVYNSLTAPGGSVMPVTIVKETYSEYEYEPYELTEKEAGALLEARLTQRLGEAIGDGHIEKLDFSYTQENGVLTVTLNAECIEEISALRELTEEEISGDTGAEK